jgi:hypothetical protein
MRANWSSGQLSRDDRDEAGNRVDPRRQGSGRGALVPTIGIGRSPHTLRRKVGGFEPWRGGVRAVCGGTGSLAGGAERHGEVCRSSYRCEAIRLM